tara:strand:- start:184 stop:465 length:282 start_codon:yes stop_codon:yes gene_type:complete
MEFESSQGKIIRHTDALKKVLVNKNIAYGNSALQGVKVFSKLTSVEALCCRLDDKLGRIKNSGINDETEDTLMDVAGYIILLQIALENERNND